MFITQDIYQCETATVGNVFFVKMDDDEWFMIDTGIKGTEDGIRKEIYQVVNHPEAIHKILLTHHDVDHIGNAKALKTLTGADLYAPKEDIPYINEDIKRPGLKKWIAKIKRPVLPVVDFTYEEEGMIGQLKPIHMPGHTPGHTIFQFGEFIFIGDMFRHEGGKLSTIRDGMVADMNLWKTSMKRLSEMNYQWLIPSHGKPIERSAKLDTFFGEHI